MSRPKIRRNLRHQMTDAETEKIISERIERAMDDFVGRPITEVAAETARTYCESVLKDVIRMGAPTIMDEVRIDVDFAGNIMHVQMVPTTARAEAWLKELKARGETHPCDCMDCEVNGESTR